MEEHAIVETVLDIYREGHYIPEGTSGTIVHISQSGKNCIVEFSTIKNNPVISVHPEEITEITED